MTSISDREKLSQYLLVALLLLVVLPAGAGETFFGGHLKYQITYSHYDSDSIFASLGEEETVDHIADLRLIVKRRWSQWDAELHYQAFGIYGDTLRISRDLDLPVSAVNVVAIDDRRRLFDLTSIVDQGSEHVLGHRLDRASLGYNGEQLVLRVGRHIVSWGNGLVFNSMDIFNPFDPTAVDKDYKTGDDMLYAQWLHVNGDDWQVVVVPRRDPVSEAVRSDQSSLAVKFHAVRGPRDVDLLIAEHYGDTVAGAGVAFDWQGSVVRGDITGSWGDDGFTPSGVASISYAWTWLQHNVTGFAEYYYNGFGQADGNYDPAALAQNSALVERIARREIYNLGRNYFAAGATIELTPLLVAAPTLFLNLDDGSGLLQIISSYDIKQDLKILAGVNLPFGPPATEYGGIPTRTPGVYFGPGVNVFLKLSFFF